MEDGVVYHALGARYAYQCAVSARTVKKTNPWLKVALFTDDVDYANSNYREIFDLILPISDGPETDSLIENLKETKRLASLKVAIAHRSPFRKTLLIDSDTLTIGDVRPAFELLNHYDLMMCHEVEHRVDKTNGWRAFGLKDDRRADYYNAGVIFFNAHSENINRFMKDWKNTLIDGPNDYARKNDQDALNYMISKPLEYLNDIRFSGTALKTREYNAFCRYWKEISDRNQWSDVKIVHTYMTSVIGLKYLDENLDWNSIINENSTDDGKYINLFKSDWTSQQKVAYADFAKNRNISMRQYLKFCRFAFGQSPAEDLAVLYSVSTDNVGIKIIHILHALKKNESNRPILNITQIGLFSPYSNLSLYNNNDLFVVGNDLDYLSELFQAKVHGVSRAKFLGYKNQTIKTSHVEYALEGNLVTVLERNQDLILDIDNVASEDTRVDNAIAAKDFLSKQGVYVIANIKGAAINLIADKLRGAFNVEIFDEALCLTSPEAVGAPFVASDFTPFSTAKIALVGNCQSSALASILRRVKDVKIEIVVDINGAGSESYKHAHWAVAHTDRIDFCFSQPLSNDFAEISSENLKNKYCNRFRKFTNLYFTGYHPDIIYLGARGFRAQSAMGDYNSRLALLGYINDMSVDETVSLFRPEFYEKLGFSSQFEISKNELLARDADNDVMFAAEFFQIAKSALPLYSVNHPTANALAPLAENIVAAIGLGRPRIEVNQVHNPLIEGSIWPIYPEIALDIGLDYDGSMTFIPGMSEERPPMTLRDFVALTFDRYDNDGRALITEMPGSIDLAKIQI